MSRHQIPNELKLGRLAMCSMKHPTTLAGDVGRFVESPETTSATTAKSGIGPTSEENDK